jgi:hypothetical protein
MSRLISENRCFYRKYGLRRCALSFRYSAYFTSSALSLAAGPAARMS